MKKEKILKILKYLLILVSIVLIISLIYNIAKYIRTGNQELTLTSSSNYYTNSKLEALAEVTSEKIIEKGKITAKLLNSDDKKVKGVKGVFELDENDTSNISLDIPEDLAPGGYTLELTLSTNVGKDKIRKSIVIQNSKDTNINVTLDKGIYKPGDEINFRTLITYVENDKPVEEDVKIGIYDGNDNRVYVLNSKTSDYGIISGKFKLADEVNSGTYKLKVETKGQEYVKQFTVNPYITPKYSAKIESDKTNYLVDETAKITVKAEYFFGEKVNGAKVTAKIGDQEFNGKTDENGEYTFEYAVTEVGKADVYATVVDTSNYMVETSNSFSAGTDLFEIEVLPVYGSIIREVSNEIFIFTKKADGTPVKAYLTIKDGKVTRQVITDEKGVGKLTLTADDVNKLETAQYKDSKYYYSEDEYYYDNYVDTNKRINETVLEIQATDMDNNEITKKETLSVKNNTGVLVSTDKVKYTAGDNIKLSINSTNDKEKTIIVSKKDKVIKMVSTTDEVVELNLEDTYGLIDINVMESNNNTKNYYYNNYNNYQYSHRTIFIKPNKELNVNVTTDLEEYEPGDKADIIINLKDENNTTVDAALLVSILDEAVLNLASNDLSIDNVKIALSDIEFSDDLDAATVYASILDDKDENTLMGLLLKQNSKENNVEKGTVYNQNNKSDYMARIAIMIISLVVIGIIAGMIKSKKFRKILYHVFIIILLSILIGIAFYEYFYYDLDMSETGVIVSIVLIATVLYLLLFNKYKGYLLKFILGYSGLLILAFVGISLIQEFANYQDESVFYIIGLLIIPTIYGILFNKESEKAKKAKKFFGLLFKDEALILITGFIFQEKFLIPLIIVDFIVENVVFKKKNKDGEKNKKIITEDGKINISLDLGGTVAIVGILALILVIMGIMNIIRNFGTSINGSLGETNTRRIIDDVEYGVVKGNAFDAAVEEANDWLNVAPKITDDVTGGAITSKAGTNLLDGIANVFDSDSKSEVNQEKAFVEAEKESKTDSKIRNVFLESLCFIPELVTKSGNATETINLSDNITTWQIQVVGNTKDGKIGYGSGTFKVFKDFFVDFSLPTNSVVGDKISIPITIYNYTENGITVELNASEDTWLTIGEYDKNISLGAKETKLVYLPIEILSSGDNKLRIEAKANELSDIIERKMTTEENGIKISNVIASGTVEDKMDLDVLYLQDYKEGTGKIKLKLYSTAMSQAVEGLENIFRMPTGCFEQVSSSLYPDILVLKYLEGKEISPELKQKALSYIESGYQKLLTYEVSGTKGGYSLFGDSPAEVVLTAYGLMEIKDLSSVYDVEDSVMENMKTFILSKQNVDGSFDGVRRTGDGTVGTTDKLTLNAYVIWALSEAFPEEKKLEKSIEYLEGKIDDASDNFTLALMANAFSNTNSKKTDTVIKKLMKNVQTSSNGIAYLTSNVRDYYGSYGKYQNIQATALTSMALTKENSNAKTNLSLINYIISGKDSYGTWGTTQATILALKALNEYEGNRSIGKQDIKVSLNDDNRTVSVEKDNLDIYQEVFNNVSKENKLKIDLEKGKMYYEVIQEYYIDYEDYKEEDNKLGVSYAITENANVNDTIEQKIRVENTSGDIISNGMIEINIPQGCEVKEESLSKIEAYGIIEKYEYSYGKIYLYLRDFDSNKYIDIDIEYKADYPAQITGGSIRLYDYYNPDIQAIAMPTKITIN